MMIVHLALDVSQAAGDTGRDLCVRWGKGEKELGVISLAVEWHTMSRDNRAKGLENAGASAWQRSSKFGTPVVRNDSPGLKHAYHYNYHTIAY